MHECVYYMVVCYQYIFTDFDMSSKRVDRPVGVSGSNNATTHKIGLNGVTVVNKPQKEPSGLSYKSNKG